jgi:formylglycine-generating enzyme required for sulfatase activity
MRHHHVTGTILTLILLLAARAAQADVFTMPSGETSLQFVTVGDPGNVADTTHVMPDGSTGYGSVAASYRIGAYDVTAAQYCDFLNAVATTGDPYGLYNPLMASTGSAGAGGCGISQSGSPDSYNYSVMASFVNASVNYVTWGDAARFCNWLQNGQLSAPEGPATTETGAYALSGGTSYGALMAITQASSATYWIPTEDEWYKAAYYAGNGTNSGYYLYPTKSNTLPSNSLSGSATSNNGANYFNGGYTDPTNYLTAVGTFSHSPGPYGAYDMGGDVYQWTETNVYGEMGIRGGSFGNSWVAMAATSLDSAPPVESSSIIGFRIADAVDAVPEPGTLVLLAVASVGGLLVWRRRRR